MKEEVAEEPDRAFCSECTVLACCTKLAPNNLQAKTTPMLLTLTKINSYHHCVQCMLKSSIGD